MNDRKIYLNGAQYQINYVSSKEFDSLTTWGMFDYSDKKIFINSDKPEYIQKETLIHELLHAIDANYNGARLQREGDEATIDSIMMGIVNLIQNNKYFLLDFIDKY